MPVIQVKVKPHARVSELSQLADGTFLAQVKAAPVAGAANEELVRLIARHFGCARSAVTIKHGSRGRIKRVELAQ